MMAAMMMRPRRPKGCGGIHEADGVPEDFAALGAVRLVDIARGVAEAELLVTRHCAGIKQESVGVGEGCEEEECREQRHDNGGENVHPRRRVAAMDELLRDAAGRAVRQRHALA